MYDIEAKLLIDEINNLKLIIKGKDRQILILIISFMVSVFVNSVFISYMVLTW